MKSFDFRGLKCPMPALMARRALKRAHTDEIIEVIADDPMAKIDIPHMCRQDGYEVVSMTCDGDVATMKLMRSNTER